MKEKISLNIEYEHDVCIHRGIKPKRCFLLLHGYLQDGEYIFNKLNTVLDKENLIIAPNAPFLIPVKKEDEHIPKYSWYFYEHKSEIFYINFDPAVKYIQNILLHFNTENLPVTIIGYSQGGYIAPKIAEVCLEVDNLLGLACSFKSKNFKHRESIIYNQIHGEKDNIVDINESLIQWNLLVNKGNKGSFIKLKNSGHRINEDFLNAIDKII